MDIFSNFLELLNKTFPSGIYQNPLFLVDFTIILLLFYWIYRALRNTRAIRIFYGVIFLAILLFISSFLNLQLLSWFLGAVLTIILIAIPVVFQPELRAALERIGRTGLSTVPSKEAETVKYANEIVSALSVLSKNSVGAILAIQRKTGLGDYIKTGVEIDAKISKKMLLSLFLGDSPLHDGAVLISQGRIKSASSILPLSESESATILGTRHRAAIGLAEHSDAIVIVVSEKNGQISLAVDGNFTNNISSKELKKFLEKNLKNQGIKKEGLLKLIKK